MHCVSSHDKAIITRPSLFALPTGATGPDKVARGGGAGRRLFSDQLKRDSWGICLGNVEWRDWGELD